MARGSNTKATWTAPEGRGAFGGFIGPRNLVELVRNAAPWLFEVAAVESPPGRLIELGDGPLGWWTILRAADRIEATEAPTSAQIADYFALCCAAHFASVATYVPTDVDAKIRRALWVDQRDAGELARMVAFALALERWDVSGISARIVPTNHGPVSGHDGERLSVLCGALIGTHGAEDTTAAARVADAIESELAREAAAFSAAAARKGGELEALDLATVLTHNAGDVMQALGAGEARCVPAEIRLRFTDLARERFDRHGGAFGRAAALYREILAAEGHRHYPLREIKLLRAFPGLLLPLGPRLDTWGETLARWPSWTAPQRAEVVGGIVEGCRKVAGQEGYYRALSGFERAHPGGLDGLAPHHGSATRHALKDADLRKKVALRRESFESSLAKRARQVLGA